MKKILVLLLAIFSVFQMKATHLMGGEITWECIKVGPDAGKYIFKLKLYRDCDGTTLSTFAQTIFVHDHPTVTSISVDFIQILLTKKIIVVSERLRVLAKDHGFKNIEVTENPSDEDLVNLLVNKK